MNDDRTRSETVFARSVARKRARESQRGWIPNIERRREEFEAAVSQLLDPTTERIDGSEAITVVPDVHYPFHPSSGTVTDPAVVGSIVSTLARETSSDILVAGSSVDAIEFERTTEYLGYPSLLEDADCQLVDLSRSRSSRIGVSLHEETTTSVSVPDPLLEHPVIVVPTLRPTEAGPVAGAMRTLARTVDFETQGPTASDGVLAAAATNAIEPELALLDAATTYAGDPFATGILFAGEPAAVDAVGARILDRSVEDDDAVSTALVPGETTVRVEGCDLDALCERVPTGELPPRTEMSLVVSLAYGLYAKVSGDAVPPQLEVDR